MNKLFFTILLSFLSISLSFGATVQEAMTVYNKRAVNAAGFDAARLAAKLGIEIGLNTNNSPEVSAVGYLIACKSFFFLGDYLPASRSDKKIEYQNGALNCKNGMELVQLSNGLVKKEEYKSILADLQFNYISAFGRWFEDEGKLDALRYWKNDVKPVLEKLADDSIDTRIYGFGPLRALGRAYFEIPGGRNKALKFLKEAYESSLHPNLKVSVYPLTTAYYAEALIAKGDKKEAKEILEATLKIAGSGQLKELHDEAYKVYGEYRWVETQEEINLCREIYNGSF